MDKIQKFLTILGAKERALLSKVLADIRAWEIHRYDVKPLTGHKGFFRLRKGKIRIIFTRGRIGGIIIDITYRKDAYKNL